MPDEPQNENTPPGRSGTGFVAWVAWPLFFLLIVYVLSIGPFARYYLGRNPPRAFETFYTPIIFLANTVHPVDRFLNWYVDDLWRVRPTAATPPPVSPTNSQSATSGK